MQIPSGAELKSFPARPGFLAVFCFGLILSGCSPSKPPLTQPSPTQLIPTPVLHGKQIRIGLVGKPTQVNVWSLFDDEGASYANYALRWEYWPRLYTLSIPELTFSPEAAAGQPSSVIPDGDLYTTSVTLREGLTWSDGKPFTAEDAAFTINTALAFELGFDWKAYYDPDYLDRVESDGASTLRYYFKKIPNVGVWQYGALQGPIVQKSYWDRKIQEALKILPDHSLDQEISEAESGKKDLEEEVDELNLRLRNLKQTGGQDRQLEAALKRAQANLDAASNSLSKLMDQRHENFAQAKQILYSLDDTGEPVLGNWMPAEEVGDVWTKPGNPVSPFLIPHFDEASYSIFEDESSAISALRTNDVDIVLQPRGLSDQAELQLAGDPFIRMMKSPSRGTWFLIPNPYNPTLTNPALSRVVACMLVNELSSQNSLGRYSFNGSYTPDSYWQAPTGSDGCATMSQPDRLHYAIGLLKEAGYTWNVEPGLEVAGTEIIMPDGVAQPPLTILASESALLTRKTADLASESFRQLGIPVTTKLVAVSDLNYALFSSVDYDLAIQGWNLSPYPSYLCTWFIGSQAFLVADPELEAECDSLEVETDLGEARGIVQKIQQLLYQHSKIIPLMSESRLDAYRNISFPFEDVINGISGEFEALSLAVPAP